MTQASATGNYTVNFSELVESLDIMAIRGGLPVMVWGGPGIGKSDAVKVLADRHDMEHIDVRPASMDPVEIHGLQYIDRDRNRTVNAYPDFLPDPQSTGRHLIVLEELVSAPPAMQVAMYQLVLDRRIGNYRLPGGAVVIAAGNRESDRGVVYKMPTPLASRFSTHLELEPDIEEWIAWGIEAGIASEVLFYLHEFKPGSLYDFDPKRKEPGFPCPRTWAFVSKFLHSRNGSGIDPGLELKILRGTLGEAHSIEFAGFLRQWRECPHPSAIIDNPDGVKIPEKVDVQIAMCGALFHKADAGTFPAVIRFAKRLRKELGEFLVSACVRRDDDLQYSTAYINEWAVATQ